MKIIAVLAASMLCASAPFASAQPAPDQTPTPRTAAARPAPPGKAPAASAPEARTAPQKREGQAVNIKVDVTITDQHGSSPAITRTVSVIVADGRSGMIRSESRVNIIGSMTTVPLNVDALPELLPNDKIRLSMNLQYDWPAPADGDKAPARGTVVTTSLHDNVSLILENGKPVAAAQSADPIGDRQVTVEVKATILR